MNNVIKVFEHQSLILNKNFYDKKLLESLESYYGTKGVPYFTLINKGVRFNEYVGVLQVGNTLIEVLPKTDKESETEEAKNKWQKILVGMLRSVGTFDIRSTSSSNLRTKSNSILDLYFEMFLGETEYLLHTGLIKKYRKTEGNVNALKGSLKFNKNIQQNLTHQERFYVNYTSYDSEHNLHFIIYKALKLLKKINTCPLLHSRIGVLLLNFPEMPDIKVTKDTFDKIIYNRKTLSYKKVIEISKMLLLQYHPDLSSGKNHVLALMFDMNKLWEQFVLMSLWNNKAKDMKILGQKSKQFWKPNKGSISSVRSDIWIIIGKENFVLDTKWKNLNGGKPSDADLKQMFVYHEYYDAKRVALVYPGVEKDSKGQFCITEKHKEMDRECHVIYIDVKEDIKDWQGSIRDEVGEWCTPRVMKKT